MKLTGPPRKRLHRLLARAPIWIYRLGLGGLLGRRLVLLTHTGRSTGRERQVVLEVIGRYDDQGYLVASGYGSRAQWYRNVVAEPRVSFQVGWRRHSGTARPLPPDESGRRLRDYARRHPRAAAWLMRTIGQQVDGTGHDSDDSGGGGARGSGGGGAGGSGGVADADAAYERIGADPDGGIPIVALVPR
ncbi:nitroreductase family deazaflavin-dependent oxidoreductase [Plantactinospora sp. WMMB334]|uniref:nitroreductase family deazaflavin-dependent oxidoreductase n=1 Tax=Plantactinospora sp. WMMB334 TaxID=3404119 RepID=UPI003B92F298